MPRRRRVSLPWRSLVSFSSSVFILLHTGCLTGKEGGTGTSGIHVTSLYFVTFSHIIIITCRSSVKHSVLLNLIILILQILRIFLVLCLLKIVSYLYEKNISINLIIYG